MIGAMFGPYRIESLVGRGGMGEVYRAVDTEQGGRRVALKVLPPPLSDDPQFVARFRREAEIAARLADPHVVPIHRYGEVDGRLFIDMQLVDGRALSEVLAQEGPLDPARALAILEQVAGAIDAAHAEGLVHRDVTPANILLTQPGGGRAEFAYLLDFGIARPAEPGSRTALTRSGAVIGTLAYMAPERFLAQPAGPAVDVYSLACVLHEVLTGASPYPGSGYAAQVAGHLYQPPPRPSAVRAGLPEAFDAVIARGMAKDPAQRYRTAAELVAAAREVLSGVEVAPAGPREAPPVAAAAPAAWAPPGTPPPRPQAVPPPPAAARRPGRSWLPTVMAAVLPTVVLVTVLALAGVLTVPGAPGPATAPGEAAPGDALPSGGPITERVIVGAAPDFLVPPVIAELDGVPVLVSSRLDETAVYDLATGEVIGVPIANDFSRFTLAATAARIDGRSVLITGSSDHVIRMWDLASGEPLPTTLTGHTGGITALAVVAVDGREVLLSSGEDATVRRWDLAAATPIGEPLAADVGPVDAMAVVGGDRPVVLARGQEGAISSFDVATGAPAGPRVSGRPALHETVATVELPGGPAVLTTDHSGELAVVDVRTGARRGHGIPEVLFLDRYAAAVVDGRPVLLKEVLRQNSIEVLELSTGRPATEPLLGHEDRVECMVPLTVGDRTFLLSAGFDHTIRIWDLTARTGR